MTMTITQTREHPCALERSGGNGVMFIHRHIRTHRERMWREIIFCCAILNGLSPLETQIAGRLAKLGATFKYLSISKSSFRFTPDFIVHVFVGPSPLDGGLLLPVFRVWEEGGLLKGLLLPVFRVWEEGTALAEPLDALERVEGEGGRRFARYSRCESRSRSNCECQGVSKNSDSSYELDFLGFSNAELRSVVVIVLDILLPLKVLLVLKKSDRGPSNWSYRKNTLTCFQRLEAPKGCPSTTIVTIGSKLFVWGGSRVDSIYVVVLGHRWLRLTRVVHGA
eukprot:scaffold3056_cov90-Skeletonema_dohrnii-CCMP3373.AAC.2